MDDFQELVYKRLQALPKDYLLSIGGETMSKKEALMHVKRRDALGEKLILIDRHYFDVIKAGKLYDNAN